MITIEQLSKAFGDIQAVKQVSAEIKSGSIFGLIGSNGAGKSTFLRLLAGIYKPDLGRVLIDGEDVYENTGAKQRIFYISDDQYFLYNGTMRDMADLFSGIYARFSYEKFESLSGMFKLDTKRKMHTFSKGMQKQAHIILALSCQPDYLFCDETFDGLDPVMRQAVKRLLADAVAQRQMTPIIASHNLRELEDICDHIGLLHQGGIVFEKEIDDLRFNIHKVQCAFRVPKERHDFAALDVVSLENRGSLSTMIVRGDREKTQAVIDSMMPLYSEMVPLTLEEIFITEMEVLGYDVEQLVY